MWFVCWVVGPKIWTHLSVTLYYIHISNLRFFMMAVWIVLLRWEEETLSFTLVGILYLLGCLQWSVMFINWTWLVKEDIIWQLWVLYGPYFSWQLSSFLDATLPCQWPVGWVGYIAMINKCICYELISEWLTSTLSFPLLCSSPHPLRVWVIKFAIVWQ